MKKAIAFLCLVAVFVCALSSCGSNEYRDDVSCESLTDAIREAAPCESGYSQFDADELEYLFGALPLCSEKSVIYSTENTDINEIGVFRTENPDAASEVRDSVLAYIAEMQEDQISFIASYAPAEVPKLEGAEVRVMGNYVIYAVLSKSERNAAFDAAEKILKI